VNTHQPLMAFPDLSSEEKSSSPYAPNYSPLRLSFTTSSLSRFYERDDSPFSRFPTSHSSLLEIALLIEVSSLILRFCSLLFRLRSIPNSSVECTHFLLLLLSFPKFLNQATTPRRITFLIVLISIFFFSSPSIAPLSSGECPPFFFGNPFHRI